MGCLARGPSPFARLGNVLFAFDRNRFERDPEQLGRIRASRFDFACIEFDCVLAGDARSDRRAIQSCGLKVRYLRSTFLRRSVARFRATQVCGGDEVEPMSRRERKYSWISGSACMLLVACATPPSSQKLTGDEIRALLTGRTYECEGRDGTYVAYYALSLIHI